MKIAAFVNNNPKRLLSIYNEDIRADLKTICDLYDEIITYENKDRHIQRLKDIEIIFSTWEMPPFNEEEIKKYLPNLKIIFYCAGSIRYFAHPFLNLGIRVVSASVEVNRPVAEYVISQIILSNKGFFQTVQHVKETSFSDAKNWTKQYPGNFQVKVGILGAGKIGLLVIEMMKALNLDVEILVYDPYLSHEKAKKLGVQKCELETIFTTCTTISCHIPNNHLTQGILDNSYFDLMLPHATFINTGRGAQVIEVDLIKALKDIPTRAAVLDVTWPEPPEKDSELYTLTNVILSPHMAGCSGHEINRIVHLIYDEFLRYRQGIPCEHELSKDMLEIMA